MAGDVQEKPVEREVRSRGEVLIAIMNNPLDFVVARDQHWYRIPVHSVENWLKARWPPEWLAFYQTKVFGSEAHAVNYYCPVLEIRRVFRWQLFPGGPRDDRANRLYYQLILGPLQRLPQSIFSRRLRRIVFIPTIWSKFVRAVEINDLYDGSPLEDRLWAELRRLEIWAERQYFVNTRKRRYVLDFAVFCDHGKVDLETDGDTWHANPDRIPLDNQRNNDLAGLGWTVLRFNGHQIREGTPEYCVPAIVESINRLGGLSRQGMIPRTFDPRPGLGPRQLTFFESGHTGQAGRGRPQEQSQKHQEEKTGMEKMIAYCGLTCTECPAFLATQQDDDSQRAQVAEMWSKEFGAQYRPEDINCNGCLSEDGRHIGYWDTCEIRACAQGKGVETCAHCDDYACEKLDALFATGHEARATLDEIRAGL